MPREFPNPKPLLIALNVGAACGNLQSPAVFRHGSEWPWWRSSGRHFLVFVACRWLTCTPASFAGCHLSWAVGAVTECKADSILPGNQVSSNTIKEIWIDQILRPSRKQNWIQTSSKLSSKKYSGHQADKYRYLMDPCVSVCHHACTLKVQCDYQSCLLSLHSSSWPHVNTLERETLCKGIFLHALHHCIAGS